MKKVIIKCFYKIKFSIFACNFFGKNECPQVANQ